MGGSAPFSGRGEGSPSKTKLLASRPTSIPSGILIHPTIWPQQIWAENWGAVPLWGRWSWVPIQHNVARAEAYLHAKFHLPSNRLATIHQRYRQTDRQRSDIIGLIVLQTVAQKLKVVVVVVVVVVIVVVVVVVVVVVIVVVAVVYS